PEPFLDISDRVTPRRNLFEETGLLGLAFPPDYLSKRYFYVNYTDRAGDTVIARYRADVDPDRADPASEQILLAIDQPHANHNGGKLAFGPDGFLYIGMGDGGSAFDPMNLAQDGRSLLGKILRVAVEPDLPQVLAAPDNPFVHDPACHPFIWALGLRNPWRFSFDRATGDLWIGDVGQDSLEEVNVQPAASRGGENYGWSLLEGSRCLRPGCESGELTPPVVEYDHSEGCAVVGGHVYRGSRAPALRGDYLYADFCSGRIWALRRWESGWANRLLLATGLAISALGEDPAGEVYVADFLGGDVYVVSGPAPSRVFPPRARRPAPR
ncbi:MAG: PQQ-dependent sugar dehydrogenase, partial [Gemmatimonadales bacterium]